MIELIDTLPDVNVQPAEYKRLLGYPHDAVLSPRARELADWARAWYAKHGRPWVYARQAESLQLTNGSIVINGEAFTSKRLNDTLQHAEAHNVILVAVGAGPQVEQETAKLWKEEKPDEYFFLEIFGSAVVEHLTTTTGARLCAWAEEHGMAVLPHYSPGYTEWDIAEQPRLLELIRDKQRRTLPGRIETLDSGMLRPRKSLLAVFGVTRHTDRVRRLSELIPCENCSFSPCQYRRASYRGVPEHSQSEFAAQTVAAPRKPAPVAVPLDHDAKYLSSPVALRKWAGERLSLQFNGNGEIDAAFRFEGTTCTNMGRQLLFDYRVKLGPREQGYPIRDEQCAPAAEDTGHSYMCAYMNNAEHLMVAIDQEKPLLGRPLNDVLSWQTPAGAAACYCQPRDRSHKWRLVLETIHYALVQREKQTV